ncbi:MAG: ATP-binding protein [Clostridiales bacterium]|nr:ATP-binding protein [Clostridiales bacterium]
MQNTQKPASANCSNYLNISTPYKLFKRESERDYYIDKSWMIEELRPYAYICVARPRRFGKSIIASMIAAYLGKGTVSNDVFDTLEISKSKTYKESQNSQNVFYIVLNELPTHCNSYKEYIDFITGNILSDLRNEYSDVICETDDPIVFLDKICEYKNETFVFVLDEWDYIFEASFVTNQDKKDYIVFLRNLLKGRPYVSMAYMTGILPIVKYSSGSDLNMFSEFTLASATFSEFFGFSETEVDELFQRYMANPAKYAKAVTRDDLRLWYSGYHTPIGERMYNPFSVANALTRNQIGKYWINSGPQDEIFRLIETNVSEIRLDIALMAAGEPVSFEFIENAISPSKKIESRDEMLSAMAIYGLLSVIESGVIKSGLIESGVIKRKACIPNKEILAKFNSLLKKESSLGYVHILASRSLEMLNATLSMNTKMVCEILEERHNMETPILSYSNENELAAIVNLAYLSAHNDYMIVRENKAGKGFADLLFFPYNRTDDCIILELKVDDTPENVIAQIKDKKYPLAFRNISRPYTGRIYLVGIAYCKDAKTHECKIEVM